MMAIRGGEECGCCCAIIEATCWMSAGTVGRVLEMQVTKGKLACTVPVYTASLLIR